MAQDEHSHKYSNSSSGCAGGGAGGSGNGGGGSNSGGGGCRSSSKKLKQKKVPQRGLGVAQLEKIISEGQQQQHHQNQHNKSDAASSIMLTPNNISQQQPKNSSSFLANFRQNNLHSPSSIHLPPPSFPFDPPSSSSSESSRPVPPPIPMNVNVNVMPPNSVLTFPKPFKIPGSNNFLWGSSEFNYLGENQNQNQNHSHNRLFDHQHQQHGLPFGLNSNFLNDFWNPTNNVMMPQFQQHSSSPMVNISTGTSSSSSIANFSIEPPSNQSFYGNNNNSSGRPPDKEKLVIGMKRSYPFFSENPPNTPSFRSEFPAIYFPITGLDESAAFGNGGGAVNLDPSNNLVVREGGGPSSSSGIIPPESNSKKVIRNRNNLDGDFLTLAPPTRITTTNNSSSSQRYPTSVVGQQHSSELPESESTPYQGSITNNEPIQYPRVYNFFPAPPDQENGKEKTDVNNNGNGKNGEGGGSPDLNLKL